MAERGYMKALNWIWNHRTKTLGFVQITVGSLATATNVFGPETLKIYVLANGLLTAWVGFFNSSRTPPSPEQ
jgi:hypothetical protein